MSSAVGFGPLPSTSTWYCRPDSVVVTPSLPALAARKALPSLAFVFAWASRSAICGLLFLLFGLQALVEGLRHLLGLLVVEQRLAARHHGLHRLDHGIDVHLVLDRFQRLADRHADHVAGLLLFG